MNFEISCAGAISRNSKQQDSQEAREKVNRYMRMKVIAATEKFDLSSYEGLHDLHKYLVGERHLMDVSFDKGSIKVTVKCRTLEILERLWEDYRSGHLNAVAEECLITEKVKDELDMKTITLTTTILEEDYLACKQSLMEIISGTLLINIHVLICCSFVLLKSNLPTENPRVGWGGGVVVEE